VWDVYGKCNIIVDNWWNVHFDFECRWGKTSHLTFYVFQKRNVTPGAGLVLTNWNWNQQFLHTKVSTCPGLV